MVENKITIEDIEQRVAALEKSVAALTTEKGTGKHGDEPRGKFASIGGIVRQSARAVETPEKPIDFSSIGGKCVRPHTAHPMYKRAKSIESEEPEESQDATLRDADEAF